MALQLVRRINSGGSGSLGRWSCASDPLVWSDNRNVCDFVYEYSWTSTVGQLLYRLLPRVEWISDSDCHFNPKHHEFCDRIRVTYEDQPS